MRRSSHLLFARERTAARAVSNFATRDRSVAPDAKPCSGPSRCLQGAGRSCACTPAGHIATAPCFGHRSQADAHHSCSQTCSRRDCAHGQASSSRHVCSPTLGRDCCSQATGRASAAARAASQAHASAACSGARCTRSLDASSSSYGRPRRDGLHPGHLRRSTACHRSGRRAVAHASPSLRSSSDRRAGSCRRSDDRPQVDGDHRLARHLGWWSSASARDFHRARARSHRAVRRNRTEHRQPISANVSASSAISGRRGNLARRPNGLRQRRTPPT